jgi:hypothetical protein
MKKFLVIILLFVCRDGFTQEKDTIKQDYDISEIQEMPQFPGGVKQQIRFFNANIRYPAQAQKWSSGKGFHFCSSEFVIRKQYHRIFNPKCIKPDWKSYDRDSTLKMSNSLLSAFPNSALPNLQFGSSITGFAIRLLAN